MQVYAAKLHFGLRSGWWLANSLYLLRLSAVGDRLDDYQARIDLRRQSLKKAKLILAPAAAGVVVLAADVAGVLN